MPFRIARLTLLLAAGTVSNLTGAQETADRIIFPHSFHVEDMGMECTECHAAVTTSTALSHNMLPDMDFCLDCHDCDPAP
ncbi:MAG: cytochrome c3 family protein, partial [Candidatus Marinimicrobia bacterium]|nr:cytochrome c3 family protein [Candidatus Neomarinimicrobiota bacterium]